MRKINLNYSKIKKELKTIGIAFCMALGVSILFGTVAAARYSEKIQTGLSESLLRFHVIANSNTAEDQELKLKVREKLLEEISPLLENSLGKDDTIEIILSNMDFIEDVAKKEIIKNGYTYNVTIEIENCKFPLKKYGDMTLPAGYYDALKIEIGEAKGENFWCVLYPTVCFVDESIADVEEKIDQDMKSVLTEEEYLVIMSDSKGNSEKMPEIKFKIVEWWQEQK